jgi:HEAT repeat protein
MDRLKYRDDCLKELREIGSAKALPFLSNETVIEPLIEVLKTDADPGVRGQAASALGRVGSPQSIPPLLEALDHDNETDSLGYSPSFNASQALDNILGSNETRIKLSDGYCKMAPWEPNLEVLKKQARDCHAKWLTGRQS